MLDTPTATVEEWTNPETGEVERKISPPVNPVDAIIEEQRGHTLTLAEIAEADDILEARVYIPEWRGSVVVRQFSKQTELDLRKAATIGGQVDRGRLEMLLIITGMVEPAVTEEHLGLLAGKSQRAIDRILEKVVALNAVSQEAAEKATAEFREER